MTIRSLGYIQFKTHQVYVSHDLTTDHIHCFKATKTRCDYESFSDREAACDYILAPFNSLVYEVIITGEDQSE